MEPTEVSSPHARATGHRWMDVALAVSAMLVSIVSLYVAVDNGRAMERLVAANSWPNLYVDIELTDGGVPGQAVLQFKVANNGVGPARLESLEIWNGREPLASAADVVAAIKAAAGGVPLRAQIAGMTVVGSVVGVGESRDLLSVTLEGARLHRPAIELAGRIGTRACFCSVFDECRVSDTRAEDGRPRLVARCPKPAVAYDDDLTRSLPQLSAEPPAGADPPVR